jgi:protein-disulfide isomerase
MSKGSAITAIVVAFVGGVLIGHLVTASQGGAGGDATPVEIGAVAPTDDADVVRFKVPVTDEQPSKGPDDALVTIVEFSDFQCPFCSRVEPTLTRVMDEYEGKVRIVWRNNPLPMHPNAGPAAELASEAFRQGGDAKFWQAHDLLFQNQRELTREKLESIAQQIGLDMAGVRRALDSNAHQRQIDADQTLARQIGAGGTPNFFVNGRQITGAQPFEAFKTVIDEEIARGQQLVRGGTPAAQVYAALTRNGRTSPAPAANPEADGDRPAPRRPNPDAVYKVEVPAGTPQRGPNDALVTIVEFSDFQCPFCSRVEPTLTQIAERYGNDVRIVWMNNPLPFHPNAGPAANAAMEAFEQGGNAKFWAMHDKLFENQRELTRENIERFGQEVGLNLQQLRAALDGNEHQAKIEQAQNLARGLGASGTPSFFINGRNLRGAQPLEAFTAVIDAELAKARQLVQQGTPRAQVYAKTIEHGATTQQFVDGPAAAPEAARPNAPDPNQRYEIAVPNGAPAKGPTNAKVVIQEFSDFQCPFCSRVNPTVEQILQRYGNRVRFVWRDFPLPFHPNAMPAAEAAREVFRQGGNEKFWQYHALLFQNQRDLTRETLERLAEQVGGVNMNEFRQALDSHRHQAAVQADVQAVQNAGARIGTPSFFINGKLVQGAQPFEAFQQVIDAELAAH